MNQIIHYNWIDTNEQLKSVCDNACHKSAVALDTEFIRTRSYYQKHSAPGIYARPDIYPPPPRHPSP